MKCYAAIKKNKLCVTGEVVSLTYYLMHKNLQNNVHGIF